MKRLVLALAVVLIWQSSASAAITGISAGTDYAIPMGDTYSSLKRSWGGHADVFFENDFLIRDASLRMSALYVPFTVRSVSTMSVRTFSILAGIHIPAKTGLLGSELYFALQAGTVYDWLSFDSAAATTANSALAFGLRLDQGINMPIYGPVSAMLSFPVLVDFARNSLSFWNTSLSLRWKL